ncbi:hypothetical protein [Paenibacillus agricola]|uniref:Uncharacterized protein n=1 Tax=Paenibacillus agricola TaxID=2716264 RepID=A0ABX0J627_9BACL|nr:hypothetical protein [Paenibacillus agricola]NHN30283.1 hypothetical protein [Paenibacillus agricola]
MNPNIPIEEDLKLLLASPKLTMKLLNELITELKQENQKLVRRLEDMERELKEQRLLLGEIAVTAEQLIWTPPGKPVVADEAEATETKLSEAPPAKVPEYVRMTRSEKHFIPPKKWFWFR